MEDLLKFGLTNNMFKPEYVLDLFYGGLRYCTRKVAATREAETFCKWDAYLCTEKDWRDIPLKQRLELISLAIKRCGNTYGSNFNCFHDRILCLMHELLNDDENRVECVFKSSDGRGPDTMSYNRYDGFFCSEMRQSNVAEMFLWWYKGLRKSDEERQLLKKCWEKFLGFDRPVSQKNTISLVEQRVEELESELKEANRLERANDGLIKKRYVRERKEIKKRHFSQQKKDFLLAQLQKKDNAAHKRFWKALGAKERCQTALAFLKGYLDYVSALAQLKQ